MRSLLSLSKLVSRPSTALPFHRRLLKFYLIMMGISAASLLIIFTASYRLYGQVDEFNQFNNPLARSALQLVTGLQRIDLEYRSPNPRRQDWEQLWQRQIEPAMATLKRHPGRQAAQLAQLEQLLNELSSSLPVAFPDNSPDTQQSSQRPFLEVLQSLDQSIELASVIAVDTLDKLQDQTLQVPDMAIIGAVTVLLVIIMIVGYLLFQERVTALSEPLEKLTQAAAQLATGRLNIEIPTDHDHELGGMGKAFTTLRNSLLHTQAELRKANSFLGRRVAERTMALERANAYLTQEIGVRQQTEEALRESEARLRAIVNAIPDLLFVLDEEGCYLEVLTSQQLFRRGLSSLKGKRLNEIYPSPMAKRFYEIIQDTLTTGQTQIHEYSLHTPSGQRWFEARAAPIEIKPNAKREIVVVARDITQHREAEEQLRQAQKMEVIGQLTGGVAHDFNNLLAIILGNLELLGEQLSHQTGLQDLVGRALDAAERGATLTQRLLAFSRQQPLQAKPTDLNDLVLGMIDMIRRTLGETIRVETVLTEDLWQTLIDAGQLENALLNLVVNARDAMLEGGLLTLETANVQLDIEQTINHQDLQPGRYVMLAVTDTGTGMRPDVMARAFDPFFTTKEVGKGSGLGLSMVYGLVKQSGGHVQIRSAVGQGTTVSLYLPLAESSDENLAVSEQVDPLPLGNAETILVVEDDTDVRRLVVRMLRSLGYQTLEAADAKGGLAILEENPQIVLLFTDVVLPNGCNGVELAQQAQRKRADLKVLFTSGYTENALSHFNPLEYDIELIPKPYRKTNLAIKLRSILAVP